MKFIKREPNQTRVVAVLSVLAGAINFVGASVDAEGSSATSSQPDKSRYNLFHPTPREFMREMSTDRPDKTESPYTIDAGHFQIEMDVLSYSFDRYNSDVNNTRVETVSIAPINLKAGLRNNVDFQLILEPYTSVRTHDRSAGTIRNQRGFGDIVARIKWNLWGNDGCPTAFAVMPFVKPPTNQDELGNDSVEGGLILPLAVELACEWAMGLMTEFDFNRDSSGGGFHTEFINSITFSHDIVGKLGGYVEFFSLVSTESGAAWIGTVDAGLTYALMDDIQLDAGVNIGVTRAADDINPIFGISMRF
ncbi:MAG: transporter [Verrucomicrobia bacterium]|nr:transporter [Verrucomicrobiota bacterium]